MNIEKTATKLKRVCGGIMTLFLGVFFLLPSNVKAQCGDIQIISLNKAICEGNAASFVAKNAPEGTQYIWSLQQDSVIGEAFDTASFIVLNTGKFSPTLELVLPSGKKCVKHDEAFVTVGAAPLAPKLLTSQKKACSLPANISFSTTPAANVTFDWIIEDANGLNNHDGGVYKNAGHSINHTFTANGYKKVIVRAVNNIGCESTSQFDSAFYAYHLPSADFTITESTRECDYKVITPKLAYAKDSSLKAQWTFENGSPATSQDLEPKDISFSEEGKYDVSLTLTSTGGCAAKANKAKAVVVGTGITPNIKIPTGQVCTDKNITFQNLSANTNEGKIEWVFPGGKVDGAKSSRNRQVVKYQTPGTYSVYFKYENGGCVTESLIEDTIHVRSFQAAFKTDHTCNCKPDEVEFVNTSSSSLSGEKLKSRWIVRNQQGSVIRVRNTDDFKFTFPAMGEYSVELKVTNELGCDDSKIEYFKFQPLKADFSVSTKMSCLGEAVAASMDPSITCQYQLNDIEWIFYDTDGKTILDRQTHKQGNYTYTKVGNYTIGLVLENGEGCKDTIIKENIVRVFKLQAGFEASATDVCIGDAIEMKLVHKPIAVNAYNTWRIVEQKTGVRVTAIGDKFDFAFDEAGIYDLELISHKKGICTDTVRQKGVFTVSGAKVDIQNLVSESCLPLKDEIEAKTVYNVHHGETSDKLEYFWNSSKNDGISFANAKAKKTSVEIGESDIYNISLQVTNSKGCVTKVTRDHFYYAGVVSRFNAPTTACKNIPFTIQNTSYVKSKYYQWNSSDSLLQFQPSSQTTHPEVVFSTPGDYKISLVAENLIGCIDTMEKDIKVVDFDFSFQSADTTGLCSPAFVSFSTTSTNVDTLIWEFGDGTVLRTTQDSVAHLYDIQNIEIDDNHKFTVKVTAISNHGCRKTVVKDDYITVWGPKPKFILKNNVSTGKTNVEFIDLSQNVSRLYINYGDNTPVDSAIENHVYDVQRPKLAYNVYKPFIVAFDDRNCKAIYPQDGKGDSVVIYNAPQPEFTVDTTSACLIYTFQLTNESKFTDSVEWFLNDVDTAFSTEENPTIQLGAGQHTIKMLAYNPIGSKRQITKKQWLTVHQLPEINLVPSDTFGCEGNTLNIYDSTSSLNNIVDWEWTITKDGVSNTYNTQHIEHQFIDLGEYDVALSVVDDKGCSNTKTVENLIRVGQPAAIIHKGLDFISFIDQKTLQLNFSKGDDKGINQYLLFQDDLFAQKQVKPIGESYEIHPGAHSVFADDQNSEVRYQLRAVNQCLDTVEVGDWHKPIRLNIGYPSQSQVNQDDEIAPFFPVLSWDHYQGWESVKGYEVWRSEFGGKARKVATVSGDKSTFIDHKICNETYQYFIKSIHPSEDWEASSRKDTTSPDYKAPEGKIDIGVTTVNGQRIITSWNKHEHPNVDEFIVSRYDDNFGYVTDFARIADTFFVDSNAYVYDNVYQYKVHGVDNCLNYTEKSESGNSIVLTPERKDDHVQLVWNKYFAWDVNTTYEVQKKVGDQDFQTLFETGNDTFFKDENIFQTEDEVFTYRVIARNEGRISASNTVQQLPDIRVFIPNAFSPNGDGVNDEYFIVGSASQNGSEEEYDNFSLSIMNRYGEVVHNTNDINEGWNGTYKGMDSPVGTYVYRVQLRDKAGRFYYHSGNITLLK